MRICRALLRIRRALLLKYRAHFVDSRHSKIPMAQQFQQKLASPHQKLDPASFLLLETLVLTSLEDG